jgi:V/A-type H+-transporting ATPase subunit D
MARLSLNKARLARETADLAMYRRYLPALDLKRQQLMAARATTRDRIACLEAELAAHVNAVGARLPMLADRDMVVDDLVHVTAIHRGTRNVAGTRVPVLDDIDVAVASYGYLTRPHWVDRLVVELTEALRLRLALVVEHEALDVLDAAIATVTRRVNLFEKVLIPRAQANIRRIRIALGDMERAAVVTSKIAKRKREAAHA